MENIAVVSSIYDFLSKNENGTKAKKIEVSSHFFLDFTYVEPFHNSRTARNKPNL